MVFVLNATGEIETCRKDSFLPREGGILITFGAAEQLKDAQQIFKNKYLDVVCM